MLVPIIIPAYEPDERLIELLQELRRNHISPIIVVNDGSGPKYEIFFKKAKSLSDVIIRHEKNKGKGASLKTAFSYVLQNYPQSIGVVTADSDGQHSVECIKKIIKQITETPNSLVLGVRKFKKKHVPWKSYFGNKLTRKLLYFVAGIKVSDSQTGLRGIPFAFLQDCLTFSENRFEFEMKMLMVASRKLSIKEIPIETIYDSTKKHQTHFNAITDSIKVYRVLWLQFIKYVFASLSSFILDILLFSLFLFIFEKVNKSLCIALATFFSRLISLLYNYTLNYKFVFCSNSFVFKLAKKYICLAVIQMILSALCVVGLSIFFSSISPVFLKIFVDTILFLISYIIQQRYIFTVTTKK